MNKEYKLTTPEKAKTLIKIPYYLARALAVEGLRKRSEKHHG